MSLCLVTGASGLIGSHLVDLLAADFDVAVISRRGGGTERKGDGTEREIRLDLASDFDECLLPSHVDAVVHLAQADNYRDFPKAAEEIFRVNTHSTVRLLDYARKAGAKHFVLASTGGLYGTGDHPFAESDPPALAGPLSFYLRTKLAAEMFATAYGSFFSISVLRFFFVYGKGQKANMLMPRLIRSVEQGTPIKLQGEDGLRINPIWAGDAACTVLRALALDGTQVLNVAGHEVLSLREIGGIIGRTLGKEPVFELDRAAVPAHLMADVSLMHDRLGRGGAVGLLEGLKKWREREPEAFGAKTTGAS